MTTEYVKLVDGEYPVTEAQIRQRNRNTSFPSPFKPTADYAVVFPVPQPEYDPATHSIRRGAPVLSPKGWYEQTWVVEALQAPAVAANLASEKARMRASVNTRRDLLEEQSFPYMGKRFDSDTRSVLRINVAASTAAAAAAAGAPFSIEWTTADNSVLALDAQQMIGVPVALAQYGNALHQHGRTLKAQIDAAQTIAELRAINIQDGWPT